MVEKIELPDDVDSAVHQIFDQIDGGAGQATNKVPLVKFLKFFQKGGHEQLGRNVTSFVKSGDSTSLKEVNIDDFKQFVAAEIKEELKTDSKPKLTKQLGDLVSMTEAAAKPSADDLLNQYRRESHNRVSMKQEKIKKRAVRQQTITERS